MQPARLPHDRVPATYRWIAPVHDLLAVVVEAEARRLAMGWARARPEERVLDVATGTGLNLAPLLRACPGGSVEAIDLSPAMLRRAERRAERVAASMPNPPAWRTRLGDAYALDFPDASFDLVVNSFMLDLLPESDFARVLAEFRRVLRPSGRLVVMTMALGPRWYHRAWEALYRVHPPLLGGCRGVDVLPAMRAVGFARTRRAFVSGWTYPAAVLYGEKQS